MSNGNTMRDIFLESAGQTRTLLAHPLVEARWEHPSALAEMTVGSLAGHLVRAVTSIDAYLDRDPPPEDAARLDAASYYLSIEGLTGDLDSELHRAIRDRATQEAEGGHLALIARWDTALSRLTGRLRDEPAERAVAALGGRAIPLDEYLVTRLVEMLVHADDLATSVDLDPPEYPTEAREAVIGCLVTVARRRHGDWAVLRALTRRERDRIDALRVL